MSAAVEFTPTSEWEQAVIEALQGAKAVDGWTFSWEYPGVMAWSHPEKPEGHLAATWYWCGVPGIPCDWMTDGGEVENVADVDLLATGDVAKDVASYLDAIRPVLAGLLKK